MSQPPQPPNQPPQGGFGAPQDPSYGYPQQPPGQPSYGSPQTPPQTPPPPGQPPQTPPPPQGPPQTPPPPQTSQPSYGYPGQQPPQQPQFGQPQYGQQGYGQPQYGQQQYGMYPPPAQYPGATPPPGSGQSRRRMLVIISAVVAVLLIVGGGIWFATSGDDDKRDEAGNSSGGSSEGGDNGGGTGGRTETVDGRLIAKIPRPKVTEQVTAEGLWVTDTVFAKAGVDKIVGYDVTGKQQKWTLPLDGSICWSSRHVTEDGKTAVLFQGAKATAEKQHQGCTEVAVIDINTGKKLWQKNVTDGDEKVRFDEVTLGGGTVAAGGTSGGAAWKLVGGKELWKPQANDECQDDGYAGGTKLVAVRRCGAYDKPSLEVQTLNPATGAPKSVFKVPSGVEYAHVASTDPLVVAIDASDDTGSGVSDFLAVDDSGKSGRLRGRIATQQGQYTPECGSTEVEGCKLLAVTQDTLYLPTKEHQSKAEYARTNEIMAFGLDGGKSKGKADAGEKRTMVPLRLEGGDIIAYKYPTYDKGGEIVSIDPKTLKQSVLLRNDDSSARTESNFRPEFNTDVVFENSRLYMGQHYVTDREPIAGEEEYLAVVFGAE
ncbi:outer membrane protein assembly factor BamB family protein [Streptomyces sp. 8N616]|uniref:outer membrane protein assembly factor BamB family protein n=1 Tax=Streptomyces sp. 8N616 TaxID=3457414 RepID=UPI003FD381B8